MPTKPQRTTSYTLVREHRFVVQVGADRTILRIEELISGHEIWGGKFRLEIPASDTAKAKIIYGKNLEEVAKRGAEVIYSRRTQETGNASRC